MELGIGLLQIRALMSKLVGQNLGLIAEAIAFVQIFTSLRQKQNFEIPINAITEKSIKLLL